MQTTPKLMHAMLINKYREIYNYQVLNMKAKETIFKMNKDIHEGERFESRCISFKLIELL